MKRRLASMMTAAEVGDELKVSRTTISAWYRCGKIPGHRLSRKVIRFDLVAVIGALESRSRDPERDPHTPH